MYVWSWASHHNLRVRLHIALDLSTAFVDRLHSYSSEPSTPKVKRESPNHSPFWIVLDPPPSAAEQLPPVSHSQQTPDESTPLLDPCASIPSTHFRRNTVCGDVHGHNFVFGHHRHEPLRQHERHHSDHLRCGVVRLYDSEDREENATIKSVPAGDPERPPSQRHQVQSSHHHHHHHHHTHGDLESLLDRPDSDAETDSESMTEDGEPMIGRKRQIVGILV